MGQKHVCGTRGEGKKNKVNKKTKTKITKKN